MNAEKLPSNNTNQEPVSELSRTERAKLDAFLAPYGGNEHWTEKQKLDFYAAANSSEAAREEYDTLAAQNSERADRSDASESYDQSDDLNLGRAAARGDVAGERTRSAGPERQQRGTAEQNEAADEAAQARQQVYKSAFTEMVANDAREAYDAIEENYDNSDEKVGLVSKLNTKFTLRVLKSVEKKAAKSERYAKKMQQRKFESPTDYAKRMKWARVRRNIAITAGVAAGAGLALGAKSLHTAEALQDMHANTGGVDLASLPTDLPENTPSQADMGDFVPGRTDDVELMSSDDPQVENTASQAGMNDFDHTASAESMNDRINELNTFIPDAHQNPAMWEGKDHPNDFGPALESRPEFDTNYPGETDSYWRLRDNGHQFALAAAEMKMPGAPVESDFATKQEYMDAVNKYGEELNHDKQLYNDRYQEYMDKLYDAENPSTFEIVSIDFPYESSYMKDGDPNIVEWDNYASHGGTAVKITAGDGTVTWRRLDCDNLIRPLPVETYVAPVGGGEYVEQYYETPTGDGYYEENPPEDTYTPPTGGGNPPPPVNPPTNPPVNPPTNPPVNPPTGGENPPTPYVKGDTPAPEGMPQMGSGPLTDIIDVVTDTIVDQGGRDNGTGGTAPIPESSSFTPGTETGIDVAGSTPAQDIKTQPGGTKVDAPKSTDTAGPGAVESTL